MITDVKRDDFGIEGKAFLEIFDKNCSVIVDIDASLEYAEKCVEMLNSLSDETVNTLCKALKIYCLTAISENNEILDYITFDISSRAPLKDMLKNIQPSTLFVDMPDDENIIGVTVECECVWELNNIMKIIFKDDEILYVGCDTDLNAWDDPEYFIDDENNFINKI